MPKIRVGEYCTFMICKKGHLIRWEEQATTFSRFEMLCERAKKYEVDASKRFEEGSQKEQKGKEKKVDVRKDGTCVGFLELIDFNQCVELLNDANISYTSKKGDTFHFCRPSHCLRHIFKYCCTGQMLAKGQGKPGTTVRKKSTWWRKQTKVIKEKEEEEEEEEGEDEEEREDAEDPELNHNNYSYL